MRWWHRGQKKVIYVVNMKRLISFLHPPPPPLRTLWTHLWLRHIGSVVCVHVCFCAGEGFWKLHPSA